MPKLPRKHQKVFASSASNNGQFGSAQTGAKVLSTDLDTLQSLAAFLNGWNDATISGQKLPTLEEMQALHYITTYQLAYLFQEGLAEWNTTATYYINSVVKKTGTFELYGSLVDNNTGNALPAAVSNANWSYLGSLSSLATAGNVTGQASSVDGEMALFSGTTGKIIKRLTLTGMLKSTSGVVSVGTAGTDYYAPGGTDVALADGGTGASTASAARTNLGIAANTNFANLKIITTSATATTITADEVLLKNSSGDSFLATAVNVTNGIGTVGAANGLDIGTEAANTWYNVFVIYNPSTLTTASLLSLSATSPTMPSGYTFKARVGAVRNDASSNLYRTLQFGRRVIYLVGTNPTAFIQMATGTVGNVATPTWVAISVSSFVPPTASNINITVFATNGNTMAAPNNSYGAISSTTNPPPISAAGNTQSSSVAGELTLESTNIYWASNSTAAVYCRGWEDNL